jgi:4'-phosphopantetheinyl transferase
MIRLAAPVGRTRWPGSSGRRAVGVHEVQAWRTDIPSSSGAIAAIEAQLPAAERDHAAAMRNPAARSRYVAGRALLRTVRGQLADADALNLNLSHSASIALLAVGRERRVGVDVERLRPHLDVAGVARLALSAEEAATVAAQPDPESERATFFACWVRKEAYLKARGEGLPGRLRGWSVVPAGRGLYAPLWPGDPETSRRWQIRSLALGDGYAGAIAYEGEAELSCFHLEPCTTAPWGAAELANSHYLDDERRLHLLL